MKRVHLLLFGLALSIAMAVGYDSHETDKDSILVKKEIAYLTDFYAHINFVAEVPVTFSVEAPFLGRPASNYILVSEELTDVFEMRIRPPPEKVQKSINKLT